MDQRAYVESVLSSKPVRRDKEKELNRWKDTDLIKVVVGPRRAGKSFLTILTYGEDVIYVNFDDERLVGRSIDEVIRAAKDVYGERRYLVLDEVHNVENWPLVVERLRRSGYNITITGSNSKMLERDLASQLTGRVKTVELLPFNYREFLRAKGEEPSLRSLEEFLEIGGYPEVVVKGYDLEYVRELLRMAVATDVVARHRIKDVETLRLLVAFLFQHAGKPVSFRNIANEAGVSVHTVKRYVSLLEEAYVLLPLRPFTQKALKRFSSPLKYYPPDHSLARLYGAGMGQLLESTVYTVLRGVWNGSIHYYRDSKTEIDFLLTDERRKVAIQVVYHLTRENLKRELRGLDAAKRWGVKTILITMLNDTDVQSIPAWEFLSNPERFIKGDSSTPQPREG